MTELAYRLPRTAKDLGIICIQRNNDDGSKTDSIFVNRARVLAALKWLIANNDLYRGVQIDKENLQKLPVNGPLEELLI